MRPHPMDLKRFATGTIVGGIVLYAMGYVIWDVLFAGYFEANAGSATGVWRETRILWATIASNLTAGALITWIFLRGGGGSVIAGLKVGATTGFLVWLSVDLFFYGAANLSNLTASLVDPLLELVHGGAAGAMIAAAVGRRPQGASK